MCLRVFGSNGSSFLPKIRRRTLCNTLIDKVAVVRKREILASWAKLALSLETAAAYNPRPAFRSLPGCPCDSESAQHRHHCRSEEHTSELQSLMRISYAVFCLKKKQYKK